MKPIDVTLLYRQKWTLSEVINDATVTHDRKAFLCGLESYLDALVDLLDPEGDLMPPIEDDLPPTACRHCGDEFDHEEADNDQGFCDSACAEGFAATNDYPNRPRHDCQAGLPGQHTHDQAQGLRIAAQTHSIEGGQA